MERWVFVQARLGSKRLQEKVLKKLGNKHVIEHLHERLLFLKSLFENLEIAYLIPDNYQNKKLEKFIQTFPNTHLFLGNEDNVLGHFIMLLKYSSLVKFSELRRTALMLTPIVRTFDQAK